MANRALDRGHEDRLGGGRRRTGQNRNHDRIALAAKVLDSYAPGSSEPVTIERIHQAVCEQFALDRDDLLELRTARDPLRLDRGPLAADLLRGPGATIGALAPKPGRYVLTGSSS